MVTSELEARVADAMYDSDGRLYEVTSPSIDSKGRPHVLDVSINSLTDEELQQMAEDFEFQMNRKD
jgi:hypothetical protein